MLKYALRKTTDGVTFPFHALELGNIAPENFIKSRKEWIDIFFAGCSEKELEEILKEDIERFQKIISAAKYGERLRIWYASSPYSKCGYYHLIHSLQDVECSILVVEMPAYLSGKKGASRDDSWCGVHPMAIQKSVSLQRELSAEERNAIAAKWEKLLQENTKLRLNVKGELTSVPKDYLDKEIISYAPVNIRRTPTIRRGSSCFL